MKAYYIPENSQETALQSKPQSLIFIDREKVNP